VIDSDQLVIEPRSWAASSNTHKFQVPFGAIPSKVDRLTFGDCGGAGAGNPSLASGQLAGRQEPEVIWVASGSWLAASSSSTRLTLTTSSEKPASDIGVTFVAGVGEASSMSMSSGNVCERPLIVRLRSVIVPDRPLTTQAEG
jgi:hypothetical protein